MDINNATDFGTVKILMLKGEKGDQGESGDAGDYSGLTNKPSINSVTLNGNKTPSDLGLATETAVQQAMSDASDALDLAETLPTLVVTIPSISALPQSINDTDITSDMVVVNSVLSNPSAQSGNWTVTTSDGSLTVAGTISGTTDLILYLSKSR